LKQFLGLQGKARIREKRHRRALEELEEKSPQVFRSPFGIRFPYLNFPMEGLELPDKKNPAQNALQDQGHTFWMQGLKHHALQLYECKMFASLRFEDFRKVGA